MLSNIKVWVTAARPKTLAVSICPVLMGQAIAMSDGFFDPQIFSITLITSVLLQIFANYCNDFFDYIKGADTNYRKGPTRVCKSGLVTPAAMKRAIILLSSSIILLCLFLIVKGGVVVAALAAACILASFLYTAGPFPFAYIGLGELLAFAFCGPIAVCGTYYLQAHSFSTAASIASLSIGACAAVLMLVNNLRDVDEDSRSDKRTLCVRFGTAFGKILAITLLVVMFIPPIYLGSTHPFALMSLSAIIPASTLAFTLLRVHKAEDWNSLLGRLGRLLLWYTTLFCIGWML